MSILFDIRKVKVDLFNVNNTFSNLSHNHSYTYDIAFGEDLNANQKSITIFFLIDIYLDPEKQARVLTAQTQTVFGINNFQELVQQQDVPEQLTTQLLGIAISTTRGILLTKCADTEFNNFLLPIINPTAFYKSINNVPVRLIERAKNCYYLGNSDKALELYTQALAIQPNNYEALFNRAGVHYGVKNYDRALEDVNRFLEGNIEYAEAYLLRSHIYQKLDKWGLELNDLNTYLKIRPDDIEALNSRANCNRLLKRFEEAKADAERAVLLNADFDLPYGTLAEIYGEQGNEELFYKYLEEALKRGFPLDKYLKDQAYSKYQNQPRFTKLLVENGFKQLQPQ